jgi:recombination protein RecT
MSNIKVAQDAIVKQEKRFKEIAPDMNFQKETMYAMQAMSNNSYLASCDPKSIASSVLSVAMSGLTLNPVMGHGYLVPRKGKAVFQPGYQGLIYLLVKSDIVRQVEARVVYENDEFSLEYGTHTNIIHKPVMKDRGEIVGFYGVATDANGMRYVEHMTKEEVMANALRSDMNKKEKKLTGAWDTDYSEMGRKTVIRRLYKYLPKTTGDSSMLDRLTEAMSSIDTNASAPVNTSEISDVPFTEYEEVTQTNK